MRSRALKIAFILVGLVMITSNKKPRGIRNNNPLNIRKSNDNWRGAVGDDGAFVQFESAVFGIRAGARILKNYRDKYALFSVREIVSRWAPPSENDTISYVESVANKIGISQSEPLQEFDYVDLIKAMIYHENGQQPYSDKEIQQGFELGFYG